MGAGRCGVKPGEAAVEIAKKIDGAPGLKFAGLQAYQGKAQHVYDYPERKAMMDAAIADTANTVELLKAAGLRATSSPAPAAPFTSRAPATSTTSSMRLLCSWTSIISASAKRTGLHQRVRDSLFIYTTVMSKAKADKAICDAGLKAQSVDSGMPVIFGRDDVKYIKCSDEHGVIDDPDNVLKLNEKLKLIPSHCDPTVNVYDWYVCVRNGRVEGIWPVTARGMNL